MKFLKPTAFKPVIASLFMLLFLAGCAKGPSFSDYASSIPNLKPGEGRIYFYRTATGGAAIQPEVKLDGEAVGKSVPKGFFYVDRPAGTYEVSVKTEAAHKVSVPLQAGEVKYVKLKLKIGFLVGRIKPEIVDEIKGSIEIKTTKYAEFTPKK